MVDSGVYSVVTDSHTWHFIRINSDPKVGASKVQDGYETEYLRPGPKE